MKCTYPLDWGCCPLFPILLKGLPLRQAPDKLFTAVPPLRHFQHKYSITHPLTRILDFNKSIATGGGWGKSEMKEGVSNDWKGVGMISRCTWKSVCLNFIQWNTHTASQTCANADFNHFGSTSLSQLPKRRQLSYQSFSEEKKHLNSSLHIVKGELVGVSLSWLMCITNKLALCRRFGN